MADRSSVVVVRGGAAVIAETILRQLAGLYPWLPSAGPGSLEAIARGGAAVTLDEGTVIFNVGQACAALPLVLEGRVRVVRPAFDGSEIFLYRVAPGDVCALSVLAILGGRPHPARAVTESRVQAVNVPFRTMLDLVQRDDVRGTVVHSLADHVERIMGRLEEVSRLSVDQRLASLLCAEGPVIEATHQALADDLDCSREVVSRVLERFQRDGLVQLGRGRVEVVNAVTLERVAATG